jgi:protein-ribulosamine 3-kinase
MDILKIIESHFEEKIVTRKPVSGGDIAQAQIITLESAKNYFLKTGARDRRMFPTEANSLKELAKAKVIRVPQIVLSDFNFLLIEYIAAVQPHSDFFEKFGRQFAEMHRFSSAAFGFYEDNFIGHTPQENIPSGNQGWNWTEFYFEKRLLFQFRLAEKQGLSSAALRDGFHALEKKIDMIIPKSTEKPALLHGDLWSGNYLADEKGNPVIIDPAVYYGHREADLALTRLFGGFSSSFYHAYNEAYPLEEGYAYRENIYKLYHVLNHLNLFGMGYHSQAVSLIQSYL